MKNRTLVLVLFTAFFCSIATGAFAQRSITGTVVDEQDAAIPGVNVIVTGTMSGTITDMNGEFSINVPEDATTITFRSIGYETQVITMGSQTVIDVTLVQDISELEEVIITGYGQTQNEDLVTSSISLIKPDQIIKDRPITRLEQSIQGATPAVVVIQESGSPGAEQTMRIRGVGTAGNATPLILLDGFQLPSMDFISPGDIAGIGIYKDAAASAIYGARGGNGVLNIQSRSGKKGDKLHVEFSTYYGIQSLASEGDYLNSQQYAEYYNNSIQWMDTMGFRPRGRDPFTQEELDSLPNTSWIRQITQNAPIQDHHLSLSGGNDFMTYYVGGGLADQRGIIKNTGYNRKNTLVKLDINPIDRVSISLTGAYTNNTRDFIPENSENAFLMISVASLPPVYPVYAESGSLFNVGNRAGTIYQGVELNPLSDIGNPMIGLTHSKNQAVSNVLFANGLVNIDITEGLKFNTSLGYLSRNTFVKGFSEVFEYADQDIIMAVPEATLNEANHEESFMQWEGYFSYDAQFGDHNISAVMGTSALKDSYYSTGQWGRNFTDSIFESVGFEDIVNDSVIIDYQPSGVNTSTLSFYTRINYNFMEKYLVGLTLRADASSKFGPENQWGFFPSVNAGWIISNEDFMANASAVNLMKIRASWGVNGNDRIPSYQHIDRYLVDAAGNLVKQDYNPDIKWEEITQLNIGLDMDLFSNRIGVTLDYYKKETADMLVPFPNPAYTGLPAPYRNAATVENEGVELFLMYRDKYWDELEFEISVNGGVNRNEVTSLGGGLPLYGANTRIFFNAPDLSLSDVGYPIASFYGYKFEGLDDIGNPIYRDIGGPDGADVPDGEISPEYDKMVIGSPYPKLIYGANLSLKFKGVDLTMFLSGRYGNEVVNASMRYGIQYTNRTTRVLDAWMPDNQDTEVMRPSATETKNFDFSDYYLEDGSYLRIKNLTLGYALPESILDKFFLEGVRFYVSANNMFTLSGYSGFDPEIGSNNDPRDVGIDRGFYPQAKSVLGGIQLSF